MVSELVISFGIEDVLKDFLNAGLCKVTVPVSGPSFPLQQKKSVTYKPVKITKLKKMQLHHYSCSSTAILGSTREQSSDMYLLFRETHHSTETPGHTWMG
jgi:hypothetical protein